MLAEDYAINLNRAVLVSPALNFEITTNAYALIYPMSLVPTQAAIAAFHGLNGRTTDPAAMAEVEDYATTAYLSGLARQGRMTPEERAAFYAEVAAMIGLEPAVVARHQARISEVLFVGALLADRDRYSTVTTGRRRRTIPHPKLTGSESSTGR